MVDGDNRKSFIKKHKGFRLHHLYFWVLADECGMLKNVLNILSAEVSGDTDNVPGDTALTKRARLGLSRTPSPSDGDRADKKKYRQDVTVALEVIGKGMTDFNKLKDYSIGLHRLSVTNDAIAQVRNAIRAEEGSIQKFRVALIVATTQEEKDLFQGLVDFHGQRVEDYLVEETALVHRRNDISASELAREKDAAAGRISIARGHA
jgi:hypothetical protein